MMSPRMVTVDPTGAAPPYEQIRTQISDQVERGELRPGDRLPTVRRLAEDLGVAANTVARAYRELEQTGLIETRGRAGSFVTGDQVERRAKQAVTDYLAQTKALGLSGAEALDLVRHQVDHPIRSS
jgi:DNA-binding transcriptional regulator YhcF (GntR family)